MDRSRYKRQLFFFLLAVLLPSTALVTVGVGFLKQQSELADNRAVEARASFARDSGRLLEDRLKDAATSATQRLRSGVDSLRYPGSEGLLWLGTYDGEQFRAAWSFVENPGSIEWGELTPALKKAEELEFQDRKFDAATMSYLRLADQVRDPRNRAASFLRAARSSNKAGDIDSAIRYARRVLDFDSSILDGNGIPIAYYAVDILLAGAVDSVRSEVITRLSADTNENRWLLPARTYMLRDLLEAATTDGDAAREAVLLTSETEYLDRIISDVPGLLRSGVADRWIQHDDRLVGTGPSSADGKHEFFAVTAEELIRLAQVDGRVLDIQFDGEQSEGALSLRPYIRDAFVLLGAETGNNSAVPGDFLVLGLILLVGLTMFGGYLLWRDVRRETRMARLRAQFVSSVSHELRTPLTSIRMFAETMLIDETTSAEDRRQYLGVIANESERLTRMLNNVLSISRIEQGTSSYHLTKGDLRDPVRAAMVAMRFAFDQDGVPLESVLPEEPILVNIDPDAVEQAVLNLLSNALKYGAGSAVDLELQTNNSGVDILVTDQGPGIDASEQVRIFDRFYRSENGQQPKVTGTGLGLSLVKHIAEAHGGTVNVQSTVDEGSTFIIHFPTTP